MVHIALIKGSWFRRVYRGGLKNARYLQIINSAESRGKIEFEDKQETTILLKSSPITMGRNTDNDIVIDDPKVSQHHCRLTMNKLWKKWHIEDLHSSNGTFVDRGLEGFPVTGEKKRLLKGDKIHVGDTVLMFD
jgi:SARP family transcriptional regulator, regulator of embCAB operon